MFYMFIKMSSGWFCKEVAAVPTADVNMHVANGDCVAFADDIEGFADVMSIKVDDIKMVD